MYPYHNKIKQRIRNGHLIGYEFTKTYPRIGECLVLRFENYPFTRPIRPHKYADYNRILNDWDHGYYSHGTGYVPFRYQPINETHIDTGDDAFWF